MQKKDSTRQKFLRNKGAVAGASYILIIAIIAILGPFIRPDSSVHANEQDLTIAKESPGFEITLLLIRKNNYEAPNFFKRLASYGWESEYHKIPIENVLGKGDSLFYLPYSPFETSEINWKSVSVADVLFDLADYDGTSITNEMRQQVIDEQVVEKTFLLGTDKYGRDLLSRLMGGAIISLAVGVIAVLISLLVGMTLGALAGYFGGSVDKIIMWLINVVWSIPTLLLVMAIVFAFGKGFEKVFIAVGLTMWVEVARVVRGQILSIREKEYVEAARALGYSNFRILFKHILPNVVNPVIVISAANFSAAILIEAGLSFLGIGAQIPTPSWGNLIKEHYAFITTDYAYLALLPGVAIMLLVLSFMLVGNGLRDALDVRS